MEPAEVEEKVGRLALLESMGAEDKSAIAKTFIEVSDLYRYEDGEVLIHADYLSFDTGFVLFEGTVAIVNEGAEEIEIPAPALLGEMSQFRSADLRSASVRSKGETYALQFFWKDLYTHASDSLPESAQAVFRDSVERQVWERFSYKNILSLAMFSEILDDLKLRVCLPFPSISDRISISGVDTLFNEGNRCNATGYLVVDGSVKIFRKDRSEKILEAPNVIGLFPGKGDQGAEWSATAMANGEAIILEFAWERYTEELVKRLTREEQTALMNSIRNNAGEHFVH